jgi:dihydroorotate dehydrogenase electron transfer subunit
MSNKRKESALIVSQENIAGDIFSMWIQTEEIAAAALPGQFISIYTKDGSKLLPRPVSLCEIDQQKGRIRLVYRVTGRNTGTEQFSAMKAGDKIDILGPLGNGFILKSDEAEKANSAMLIAGGIGVPPMLELAKQLKSEKTLVMGYRNEPFLEEEFSRYGNLFMATENGCAGTKGNVLDAIEENELTADIIYACGPAPMLRAVKQYAEDRNIVCYVSMEEKMACGIGACLACVCSSSEVDEHSHVHNKRVCKDGPVFLSTEVII